MVDRERVPGSAGAYRIKLKVANRDLYGNDFVWVDEAQIARREMPPDVAVVERTEWGLLIGTITALRDGDRVIASGPAAWDEIRRRLPDAAQQRAEIRRIERSDIGAINHRQEQVRLRLRRLELGGITGGAEVEALQQPDGQSCRRATRSRRPAWPRSAAARRRASWWRPTAGRRRSCRWPRSSTSISRTG